MPGIGEQLRAARSARGLTIQDVQRELRIREKYLEALESEQFDDIPGLIYARGFLRSYARYLGLDADALTKELPAAAPSASVDPAPPHPTLPKVVPIAPPPRRAGVRKRPARQWPWVVLPILFLVALLYYVGSLQRSTQGTAIAPPKAHQKTHKARPTSGGSTTPSGGNTAGQTALTQQPASQAPQPLGGPEANYLAAQGPIQVTLTLSAPCWVDVTTDGTTAMETIQSAGTFTFTAQQAFFIKVGNPPAATLTVDGQQIPLPGTTAESVAVQVQG